MNKKLFFSVICAMGLNTPVSAQPIYVQQTGARDCYDCHLTTGGYKPEVIAIVQSSTSQADKIAKLTTYVHSLTTTTSPDTAPILGAVDSKWNITVGELPLAIPFQVTDAEHDTFDIHGSAATGVTVSAITTNNATNLPTFTLKWTPTAAQANKNYPISIYVRETGAGRILSSNTVATNVKVWPARTNAATAKTSQFTVQTAKWTSNSLQLTGQVLFKSTVTAAQRTAALASLKMTMTSQNGTVVGSAIVLAPNATGNWSKTISLTASQVPCTVVVNYDGLKAERSVASAPAATCVK